MRTVSVRIREILDAVISTSARLLRLLGLLQQRSRTSAPDLAGGLGVTTRTVRRDITRLRELGYPVVSSPGAAGGYGLGHGGTLPTLLLDEEEATAVAVGLRLAAGAGVEGLGEQATRTLQRIEQFLPARSRQRLQAMHAATLTLEEAATIDAEVLSDLATACQHHVEVRLGYVDRRGHASRRRAEPHRLVRGGRRWYLVARDLDRDDWRTFRVDRIDEVHVTTWQFTPQEPPEPAEVLVSRAMSSAPYRVRVRIHVEAPLATVAERIPPTAGVLSADGQGTLLETGADSVVALGIHLGALGLPLRLLGPPEVAQELRGIAERLLRAAGG